MFLCPHSPDNGLDEIPDGRLQPFIVKDTHIEGLMPVFQGHIPDTGMVFHALIGNEADPDAGKCVKCGACMASCKLKAIVKK